MEGCTITKYAVVNRATKLTLHHSSEIPPENTSTGRKKESGSDEINVPAGTLIKIFQTKGPASVGNKLSSTVQVLDFVNRLPIYENLYECPQSSLNKVNESLWPYVISIVDPDARLRMIKDHNHCKWFPYLKPNDFVSVSGEMFGHVGQRFDCIIRYIGPVSELHPVGYFFGLELLVGTELYLCSYISNTSIGIGAYVSLLIFFQYLR